MSIRSRLESPINRQDILLTFDRSKPDTFRYLRLVQPVNISPTFETEDVSKPDKSSLSRLLQPWNMAYMTVTPDVLNPVRFISLRLTSPSNIWSIWLPVSVRSNPDTSRYSNPVQPENISW